MDLFVVVFIEYIITGVKISLFLIRQQIKISLINTSQYLWVNTTYFEQELAYMFRLNK
jgi:hypothetical protein